MKRVIGSLVFLWMAAAGCEAAWTKVNFQSRAHTKM